MGLKGRAKEVRGVFLGIDTLNFSAVEGYENRSKLS